MGLKLRLDQRDRRIVALAVPALGTLAVEPLYVLVDTAIVGRLGTVPLGGLALASTVLSTLLLVCNFLAYGTTARVAFLTGGGNARGAAGVWAGLLAWVVTRALTTYLRFRQGSWAAQREGASSPA